MPNFEVMETLFDGRMAWTLRQEHYAKLPTVHYQLLLRIIAFSHRQYSDHMLQYSKTLKKAQCKNVEITVVITGGGCFSRKQEAESTTGKCHVGCCQWHPPGGGTPGEAGKQLGYNAYRSTSRLSISPATLPKTVFESWE